MKKICYLVLLVFCLTGLLPVFAGKPGKNEPGAAEQKAYQTVQNEIKAALTGKSEHARKIGRYTDFYRDLLKLLKKHNKIAAPKSLKFNDKTVKILVPLELDEKTVGGFFQVSADGTRIISYLPWKENLEPLFTVPREKWEKAESADELEELKELVPLKDGHSAGVPVELSDLTDVYLIDYVDQLPCKTQEELEQHTSRNNLKSSLGRRTGSSKCLSYSASLASDWWNMAQGNKLGNYISFVNGSKEYGLNPRAIESLYFKHPKCPYSFVKETGKDRVTGEKIPYSPKHYAYIMSHIDSPSSVKDPLRRKLTHHLPRNGFGMDLPFDNSFNKSHGKIKKVKSDLKKYGIIYAQHTSRLFKNKIPVSLQGVHSVNIVGTGKLKGKPVAIYYETFGKNNRDYVEDSFYGPALRAFPIKFFYQGIYFPHRIIPEIKIEKHTAKIWFKTHEGKKITPTDLKVEVNGKRVKISPDSFIRVNLGSTDAELKLCFSRKYFYVPEESNGYVRNYLISGKNVIELTQYESMLKELAARKSGLISRIFGKSNSYKDYLTKAAQNQYSKIEKQLFSVRNDSSLMSRVAAAIKDSKVLKSSPLGKMVKEMATFDKINKQKPGKR
jgi:hypothetical protein